MQLEILLFYLQITSEYDWYYWLHDSIKTIKFFIAIFSNKQIRNYPVQMRCTLVVPNIERINNKNINEIKIKLYN